MSGPIAVGIDLGTTHTIVAIVNDAGRTDVLRDHEGDCLLPSVVLFDTERTIIGHEARLRGRMRPTRLAVCPKRDIGQRYYRESLEGMKLPPEVIEACILNGARTAMLDPLGTNFGVVIAVPAHFNERQRQATAAAGEMAGLQVLDIINEPVAVALAFAEHAPLISFHPAHPEPARLLVFDLGGHTFEATLLEIAGGTIRTVETEQLPSLGGHNWDLRLIDIIAERFIRKHAVDPRESPAELVRLLQLAAQSKIALTAREHTAVSVSIDGMVENVRIAREDFEGMTSDLLAQTLTLCERLLVQAGWNWNDLTSTLLVGGATRMPMVSRTLEQRLGKAPDCSVSADEAVARGAALYAASLLQVGLKAGFIPQFKLANVSTHSLGIEGVDPLTGQKTNKILLPRGTPLPAKVTREFVTRQTNQRAITIKILEGESSDPRQCVTIGRVAIRGLPAEMSDQWPVQVTYEYDAHGRLSVDARIRYTEKEAHLETARLGGVSELHRSRWSQLVKSAPGFASYQEMNRWVRAMDAPPPVVVVSSEDESATAEQPQSTSLLRRLIPFAFRKGSVDPAGAEESA